MTQTENKTKQTFDPGALMLAMYVLGVAALVLAGWFGPADSGAVMVTAPQAVAVIK